MTGSGGVTGVGVGVGSGGVTGVGVGVGSGGVTGVGVGLGVLLGLGGVTGVGRGVFVGSGLVMGVGLGSCWVAPMNPGPKEKGEIIRARTIKSTASLDARFSAGILA